MSRHGRGQYERGVRCPAQHGRQRLERAGHARQHMRLDQEQRNDVPIVRRQEMVPERNSGAAAREIEKIIELEVIIAQWRAPEPTGLPRFR